MKNIAYLPIMLMAVAFLFTACDKEDPTPPNEEELITTLIYTLTPTDGSEAVTFSFVDIDGDGNGLPEIQGGTLTANTSYTGSITLLNEAEDPSADITTEVAEEADEHQFFFQTDLAGLTIDYADQDPQGNPLGLATTVTTADPAAGSITIILRHEPAKTASGVATGDITNAGGETDIEVTFPVVVQ